MPMKSESQEEARARLEALSEAEKRGAAAASEGQLQPNREVTAAEDAVTFARPQPVGSATQTAAQANEADGDEGGKRKAARKR